ncbi:MAG: DUF1835 domain-containing protein [Campylobacterales bacterium]|nr:DUF1835 domain-containing protein [Campylobacterales bacterium]
MNKILNIVSCDEIIKVMKQGNIPGNFLAWQDFLYFGPVPQNLTLEALSTQRAEYISSQGLEDLDTINRRFKERNGTLHAFRKYDRIILWFEHDLCDQLQLIQILDWFARYATDTASIFLILPDRHLAFCSPEKLKSMLLYNKEPITPNQLIVARKAWAAFTAPTPEAWFKLLHDDISSLPFLKQAVLRLLEEFPNTLNGLSRATHFILLVVVNGKSNLEEIFQEYQRLEKRRFMKKIHFVNTIKQLIQIQLLESHTKEGVDTVTITPLGRDVLKLERNWLHLNILDWWIGGTHITEENLWCWDIKSQKIVSSRKPKA